MDDQEGYHVAQGVMAARRARRGDFIMIYARLRFGISLTADELHLKEQHEQGAKQKTGPKDPQTDFQTYATWRWLYEVERLSKTAAYSLIGEMTGKNGDAIKAMITRTIKANNLGSNIADLSFDRFTQQDEKPPLLQHRSAEWRCIDCRKVHCICEPLPRADWDASAGGVTARTLKNLAKG